jgi:hypothetical protein
VSDNQSEATGVAHGKVSYPDQDANEPTETTEHDDEEVKP